MSVYENDGESSFEFAPLSEIDGAFVVIRKVRQDHRGNFSELYREGLLEETIGAKFVQANQSFSDFGVLRGLHFQRANPQGKLVTSLFGEVLDVMLDLRPGSPTFLRSYMIRLNWTNGEAIYVPPGCAHGFLVLSRYSIVHYNCTSFYDPKEDAGVRWNSPEIVDCFGRDANPILSAKDSRLPTVSQYLMELEHAHEPGNE